MSQDVAIYNVHYTLYITCKTWHGLVALTGPAFESLKLPSVSRNTTDLWDGSLMNLYETCSTNSVVTSALMSELQFRADLGITLRCLKKLSHFLWLT